MNDIDKLTLQNKLRKKRAEKSARLQNWHKCYSTKRKSKMRQITNVTSQTGSMYFGLKNYLYLRLRAASDFNLRLTEGFS